MTDGAGECLACGGGSCLAVLLHHERVAHACLLVRAAAQGNLRQPPRTLSPAQSCVCGRMALLTLAPRPLPCWICSVLPTRCISRQYICAATTTTNRQHSTPRPCAERVEGTDVVEAGPAVCLDDLVAARRAEAEEEACPQRYRCHLEKNATQMPAISWRLTCDHGHAIRLSRSQARRGCQYRSRRPAGLGSRW